MLEDTDELLSGVIRKGEKELGFTHPGDISTVMKVKQLEEWLFRTG